MLRSLFGLVFLLLVTAVTQPLAAQRKTRFMKQLEKTEREKAEREAKERPYKVATTQADSLFRLQQYQPAIGQYQLALAERPGDAFSLAKITDLRIILKLKDNPSLTREEAKTIVLQEMADEGIQPLVESPKVETPAEPEPAQAPVVKVKPIEEVPAPVIAKPQPKEIPQTPEIVTPEVAVVNLEENEVPKPTPKVEVPTPPTPKRNANPVSVSDPKPQPKSVPEVKEPEPILQEDGSPYPQGITEEVIKEEHSVTIQRVVQEGVRTDVYRKVTHDWGGVFFFKNGVSITERVWKEESGKK